MADQAHEGTGAPRTGAPITVRYVDPDRSLLERAGDRLAAIRDRLEVVTETDTDATLATVTRSARSSP